MRDPRLFIASIFLTHLTRLSFYSLQFKYESARNFNQDPNSQTSFPFLFFIQASNANSSSVFSMPTENAFSPYIHGDKKLSRYSAVKFIQTNGEVDVGNQMVLLHSCDQGHQCTFSMRILTTASYPHSYIHIYKERERGRKFGYCRNPDLPHARFESAGHRFSRISSTLPSSSF